MDKKYLLKSSKIVIEPSNEQDLWNADWIISFADGERRRIGRASFAGEKALGTVPLYVELEEEFRDQGYGTQAICMMVDWAFRHSNVYEVKAEAEHENDKAVKALGKAGFVYRSEDKHIEQYSVIKNKSAWTGLYMMIGIFLGIFLGIVLSSPKLGMGIGLVVSIGIGIALDNGEKHRREQVTGKKDD